MRTETVTWFSGDDRVSGLLRTPDTEGPYPGIVQGPGWLGLKDAKLYVRYHQALTDAGFAVLIFDYRGFGDSEGDSTILSPHRQLEDLTSAVTYLSSRDDIDADRLGAFGSGGTGGGNAVLLAATDTRVRAVVSQLPVADGRDWLHRMRSEYQWLEFLAELDADRTDRAINGGPGQLVDPREQIMVPTAERRRSTVKSDVDGRVPTQVRLSSAWEIIGYSPEQAAASLHTPLLVIAVDNDATTPTDHATKIYRAARGPKELILQRNTSHYAAYDKYWAAVTPRIVAWFQQHLEPADVVISSHAPAHTTTNLEVLR